MNDEVLKWIGKITKAESVWQEYEDLIDEIRSYYANKRRKNKQNIFWSSIETLKPFIYFKPPVPYVERKDKKENKVLDAACQILEKALAASLESQDFDGVMKYARNDYLTIGLGLTYEKVDPVFKTVFLQPTEDMPESEPVPMQVLDDVRVLTNYIDPKTVVMDCTHVRVWEDVSWVAQRIEMTKAEVIEQFGSCVADELLKDENEDEERERATCVYKIWDKKNKKILYLSKEVSGEFLRVDDDVLNISGFFPFPKPVFATLINDGVVPVPDYVQIKCLLDELDGVNSRMQLVQQALKISGAYDGAFPELANILNKDVTLVEIADFEKVREKGGLSGFMEFAPIEQYIRTLQALAERRTMLMSSIFEITGVSDIMRGSSNPTETATAVTKKTNFGTLRNQDRQNDFQRFVTDVLKIKAELICEQTPAEQLKKFADNVSSEYLDAAILLLKEDKLRNLTLGIETDVGYSQSEEALKANGAVVKIHQMVMGAFNVISAQPLLLPLYKQMIESMAVTLPQARQFSGVIDNVFEEIQHEFSKGDKPDPEMIKATTELLKNQHDFEIKRQANAIKQEEVNLKKQIEADKVALTNKEMDLQAGLAVAKLKQKNKGDLKTNISTGYVKGF